MAEVSLASEKAIIHRDDQVAPVRDGGQTIKIKVQINLHIIAVVKPEAMYTESAFRRYMSRGEMFELLLVWMVAVKQCREKRNGGQAGFAR